MVMHSGKLVAGCAECVMWRPCRRVALPCATTRHRASDESLGGGLLRKGKGRTNHLRRVDLHCASIPTLEFRLPTYHVVASDSMMTPTRGC